LPCCSNGLDTRRGPHNERSTGKCSTPFGINGLDTRPSFSLSPGCVVVLNAFRHQRTRHVWVWDFVKDDGSVLNAFRHQRTRHQHRGILPRRPCLVLNAFRHQRTRHK